METVINNIIKVLTVKAAEVDEAQKALNYTQAALNLAHVLQVKKQIEVTK